MVDAAAENGAWLVSVALPVPLRQCFDYRIEPETAPALAPGMRVRVPFGRRELIGVVVEAPALKPLPAFACRDITALCDTTPLLPAELLQLCQRVAHYYHHPLGEVIAAAMPAPLRSERSLRSLRSLRSVDNPRLQITAAGLGALARPRLPAALRSALQRLAEHGPQTREALQLPRSHWQRAEREGWLETAAPQRPNPEADRPPALTAAQASALAALRAQPAGFGVSLLEGVTGSGKTEVYLQRTADLLAAGQQVLVLVPEIGLTPQLVERFVQRFGAGVAPYHSGISEARRAQTWLAARDGALDVIVGTRSAVFVPLARPGLVIVDEEHDGSYKQTEGFRYSGRDVAMLRAQRAGIPVLLGSATPSLESRLNADQGRYLHLQLPRRVHDEAPPSVKVIDVRGQRLDHGLSRPLTEALERHLAGGGQALLFINRRGFAPVLHCKRCGWIAPCPQCDARMTLHRSRNELQCHHCGSHLPPPPRCPDCGDTPLTPLGYGTERIEEALRRRFPEHRTERFDSDRLGNPAELAALLQDVREQRVNLLVGTQILAKGHDFAHLSLVCVVDVDQGLFGSDFRATERMAQLVTQVAGRAGRTGAPAEVLLQTQQPQHPLLRQLACENFPAISASLLAERRAHGLPPCGYLALLRAQSRTPQEAQHFLEQARTELQHIAPEIEALGPVPAPMERRAGLWRAQLLLQHATRPPLHRALDLWLPAVEALKAPAGLRWSLDVDPQDLF